MKRLALALLLAAVTPAAALAQDWEMVQRDALHSGSIPEGPAAPLRRAWVARSEDPKSSFTTWPVVGDGVVYARSGPGLIAVEAATGERVWWRRNPEGSAQVAPALDERALYISVPFGTMLAVDRKTGAELWRFKADDSLDASSTLADGRLYVGSEEAKMFYCLNSADGSLVWKLTTELEPDSTPAISDGVVVLTTEEIGSERVIVLALDAATGTELWRVSQKESNSSPSVLDGKVILGGGDFFAHALDLKTGKQVWKSPVDGRFDVFSMPAIAFGDVFLADRIGNIYRLDGKTGKRKWIFRDTIGTMDQSSPVVAGKTLFIGSGAGWLYALDTDTGRLLWKEQVGGVVLSGAADSERFYFGVKLRNEGLYAYEHDPKGRLEPPPRRPPGPLGSLLRGLLIFAVVFGAVFAYGRRRRARAPSA